MKAVAFLVFTLSGLVIALTAVGLTKLADRLAEATGLSRVWVGATALAAITSLPEFLGAWQTGHRGLPDLAVGSLVGSNLCNLTLMAITLLYAIRMRPSIGPASLVWPSAWLSLAMISLTGLGLLVAPASELLRASWPLWLLLVLYLGGSYLQSRGEYSRDGAHPAPGLRQQFTRTWKLLLEMVGLGLVIALAMNYLVSSAEMIATQTGLGETFVGTLLMALVTSLPELAAGLAAARMGLLDMAIGNYLGSNALNMVMLVVADLAFEGSLLARASVANLATVGCVVVMTFLLMSVRHLLATSLGSRWRWGGALAVLSIGLYAVALALIFSLGGQVE